MKYIQALSLIILVLTSSSNTAQVDTQNFNDTLSYFILPNMESGVTVDSIGQSIQNNSVQLLNGDCEISTSIPVVGGTLCGGGSITIQAMPASGAVVEWFSDASGTNLIGTGNTFTTPNITATTIYYAQSKSLGNIVEVGANSPLNEVGTLQTHTSQVHISFEVSQLADFQSIDIYPVVSGETGTITIRNSTNIVIGTYSYTTSVSGGTTPQTIPLGLNLSQGNYILAFETLPASGLTMNTDVVDYPYPYLSSVGTILGNDLDSMSYMYAYNWKFLGICQSLLTPVTVTVTAAPSVTLSDSLTSICLGETTSPITLSGYGVYDSVVWTPSDSVTGNPATGYAFNPIESTNYVLTVSQSSGSMCKLSIGFYVTVKPVPDAISIVPASASICEDEVRMLSATLAASTSAVIFDEKFNDPVNVWTTSNFSTGGISANAAWTLRNSPYVNSWNATMTSNDASQFYFTSSDAQGGPNSNRTQTYLESPTLDFTGYINANMSFWHYLRRVAGDKARVEATIDNGATWITMASYTAPQGAVSNFVLANVDLSSLIGNPAVKIRFYYDAKWSYGWAIDNILITGNLAVDVVWTPVTGLYFDSATTNPYIEGTPTSVVYAKPDSTTTYTGTANGFNGCFSDNSMTITVTEKPEKGILSSNQTVCSNQNPDDITLTGYTNSIVNWQYADDEAFTTGVNLITNTNDTLTGAEIGSYNGDRYFRAVLQNGTCPVEYSDSVLISRPTTIWNGTSWSNGVPSATKAVEFQGNYTSAGDLSACSVRVLSGDVLFASGHTLTVAHEVHVIGGTLTFEDDSSLYQVSDVVNAANIYSGGNLGNISMERDTAPIFRYDYTYWSSPVHPQTLLAVSPNTLLVHSYQFNPSINDWVYFNPNGTMVPGKGYILRAPLSFNVSPGLPLIHTAGFFGVPNNGTITMSVVGGASQMNLLGNPYPSALSAEDFILENLVVGGTLYFWTHNTQQNTPNRYSEDDYALYNLVGGTATSVSTGAGNNSLPLGYIASGQGFFVEGMSNGTVTFTNSMRRGGNNTQFYKTTDNGNTNTTGNSLEKHRYWLDITDGDLAFKQLLIGYVETATAGIDRLFDAKAMESSSSLMLYTKVGDEKLSILGKPLSFDVEEQIPLSYKSMVSGQLTIRLSDYDGLFTTQNIYLEDKLLNVIHSLKESDYSFTTTIGTFENRFVLRYTNNALGVNNPLFNENSIIVYNNPQGLFVDSGVVLMKEVMIYDVRGRLLATNSAINATSTVFTTLPLTQQVLLVKVISEDDKVVTKKVVY